MSDVDHDHDDEGNCIQPSSNDFYNVQQPCWRFSMWDIAAIGVSLTGAVVGGTLQNIGMSIHQAAGMVSREFTAAANFQRQTFDLEEAHRLNEAARAQMAAGLRELVEGDGS